MFSFREYREPSSRLPDRLPWACLVAPGVVLQKDAIFQRTLAFRGPDLASSLDSELLAASARLNNALRRLGSGWGLFIEAQRFLSSAYPAADWLSPAAAVVDRERRLTFEEAGAHYESSYYLTFAWKLAARPRGARGGPLLRGRRGGFPRSRRAERARARALHLPEERRRDRRHPAGGLSRSGPARRRADALVPAQHHLDPPPSGPGARDAHVPRRGLAGHALHAGRCADARRPLPLHVHDLGLPLVDVARPARRAQPLEHRVPLGDAVPVPRQGRGQGPPREVPKAVVGQAKGALDDDQGGGLEARGRARRQRRGGQGGRRRCGPARARRRPRLLRLPDDHGHRLGRRARSGASQERAGEGGRPGPGVHGEGRDAELHPGVARELARATSTRTCAARSSTR